MRIALIISLALLLCSVPCFAQQSDTSVSRPSVPGSVKDLLDRAAKLSQAGRGRLAITMIREAIKISPNSPALHLALGNELARAGLLEEAIAAFERARELNPRDDRVYASVGLVMLQRKKYAVAISLFSDASLLNPKAPLHHFMRGVVLVRQAADEEFSRPANRAGNDRILSQAEEALTRAFDLSGGRLSEVYLYRAKIYEIRGARLEAAAELEKYLKANPDSDRARAVREAIRDLRAQSPAPAPAP